ncbi:hypothetical protein [Acidithiobacillus sp.]|uniref:hypothetical protein n=1 Tax=Acidithiobacillus sp. TaxID=1872118 RepID=UPI00258AA4BA|nr:hypothetical protein [Acidithiobacillus sp.]MDD5375623.1 hypothetical protein [Acidithiobacillus sp.]
MSNPLRQVIAGFNQRLITFFERPGPRKLAEALLWGATQFEWLFFFPFRPFTAPARFFLDRRAKAHRGKSR